MLRKYTFAVYRPNRRAAVDRLIKQSIQINVCCTEQVAIAIMDAGADVGLLQNGGRGTRPRPALED